MAILKFIVQLIGLISVLIGLMIYFSKLLKRKEIQNGFEEGRVFNGIVLKSEEIDENTQNETLYKTKIKLYRSNIKEIDIYTDIKKEIEEIVFLEKTENGEYELIDTNEKSFISQTFLLIGVILLLF